MFPSTFCVIISSFFGVGYLPLVPGTFGSLAGLALIYFLKPDQFLFILLTLVFAAAGFLCAGQAERAYGKKDFRVIVIDEVSGIFVTFLFLPLEPKILAIGFVLFRALDTLKPFPAGRLQRVKGSAGIMADDLIAGAYANLILQVALKVTSLIGS